MLSRAIGRNLFPTLLIWAGAFWFVSLIFHIDNLIIILNGLFVGTFVAAITTFAQLFRDSFVGMKDYTRVKQFALALFLFIGAYALSAYTSVQFRAFGEPVTASYLTAFHRYMAISALILMVTAPTFGMGYLYGKDRRLLWVAVGLGLAVALFVAYAQYDAIFAHVPYMAQLTI